MQIQTPRDNVLVFVEVKGDVNCL